MNETPAQRRSENGGMPTEAQLLALADHFDKRGDSRAKIARTIRDRDDVRHLLPLLRESDQHEAACVFAERALVRERDCGREPNPRSWTTIAAKRAWMRGEISGGELRKVEKEEHERIEAPDSTYDFMYSGDIYRRTQLADLLEVWTVPRSAEWAAWGASIRNALIAAEYASSWAANEAAEAIRAPRVEDMELDVMEVERDAEAARLAEKEWQADWIMKKAWEAKVLEEATEVLPPRSYKPDATSESSATLEEDAIAELEAVGLHVMELDGGRALSVAVFVETEGITDATLEYCRDIDRLEELTLPSTPVTDVGLSQLEGLTNLKRLPLFI